MVYPYMTENTRRRFGNEARYPAHNMSLDCSPTNSVGAQSFSVAQAVARAVIDPTWTLPRGNQQADFASDYGTETAPPSPVQNSPSSGDDFGGDEEDDEGEEGGYSTDSLNDPYWRRCHNAPISMRAPDPRTLPKPAPAFPEDEGYYEYYGIPRPQPRARSSQRLKVQGVPQQSVYQQPQQQQQQQPYQALPQQYASHYQQQPQYASHYQQQPQQQQYQYPHHQYDPYQQQPYRQAENGAYAYGQQQCAASPPRYNDGAYAYGIAQVQAPVLGSRHVQLTEPYYGQPVAEAQEPQQQAPVAPAEADPMPSESTLGALSQWFADCVCDYLINPGQIRPGASGSSPDRWSPHVVEREARERYEIIAQYGHVYYKYQTAAADQAPQSVHDTKVTRNAAYDQIDPFGIGRTVPADGPAPRELFEFVLNIVRRMSMPASHIIHGVWFVQRLGLHVGDGDTGFVLRRLLNEWSRNSSDLHVVTKHVALLGLLLAGKWLDDNSFATRSYAEVTDIPAPHIVQMERAALQDMFHSVYVPPDSWYKFLDSITDALYYKNNRAYDRVLVAVGKLNMEFFQQRGKFMDAEERRKEAASQVYQQAVQPLTPLEPGQDLAQHWQTQLSPPALYAAAPEESGAYENVVEDDADEDVEYDGAIRWLPTAAELRRMSSNSSHRAEVAGYSSGSSPLGRPDSNHASLPRTPPGPAYTSRAVSPTVVRQGRYASAGPSSSPLQYEAAVVDKSRTVHAQGADAYGNSHTHQSHAPSAPSTTSASRSDAKSRALLEAAFGHLGPPPTHPIVQDPAVLDAEIDQYWYGANGAAGSVQRYGANPDPIAQLPAYLQARAAERLAYAQAFAQEAALRKQRQQQEALLLGVLPAFPPPRDYEQEGCHQRYPQQEQQYPQQQQQQPTNPQAHMPAHPSYAAFLPVATLRASAY